MPYMLYGMVIAVVFVLLVAAIAVPLCKKFRWGLDAESQITLRPEETLIAAIRVTDDHGQTTWTILRAYRLDRSGNAQSLLEPPDNWRPGDDLRAAVWSS